MLRFSLITPAYCAQSFLPDLARSLLAQTAQDWEWLVVADDLKTLEYEVLLRPLVGERLTVLSTGRVASGPAVTRNIGLAAACGDLLCCVDADDLFEPKRLAVLGEYAQQYGVACDNHQLLQYETHAVLGRTFPLETQYWTTIASAMQWNLPFFPVFHRHYLQQWDEDIRFAEDVLFNLRLLHQTDGIYIHPEPLLNYRIHRHSISNTMPEGYFRAKQGYDTILNKLSAVNSNGSAIYLHDWSPELRTDLCRMFQNKRDLNDQFWAAYQAGRCQNFSEFQAQVTANSPYILD